MTKTYYVTVEGIVERVFRIDADNVADAMKWAKADFKSELRADVAQVIKCNEEKTK
jgi:C4-type Zn-finger protein